MKIVYTYTYYKNFISCRKRIMRLEKYLSDCGIGTRSQCKKYIREGAVRVNGETAVNGALQVSCEDEVFFRDTRLMLQKHLYFMFHKPAGCICATKDEHQKTVLDYFPAELSKKLLIAGRLDKDTEGLLLLTDNGDLIHRLMSPKKHMGKTYFFKAYGKLPKDAVSQTGQGIDIGDEQPTKPGKLKNLCFFKEGQEDMTSGFLTIYEGRYHQVKRMIHVMGCEVFYLKRVSIGGILLDESLMPGTYRPLTKKELQIIGIESGK